MQNKKVIILAVVSLALIGMITLTLFWPKTPKRAIKYTDYIVSPIQGAKILWGKPIVIKLKEDMVSDYDSISVEIDNYKTRIIKDYSIKLNAIDFGLGVKTGYVNLWQDGQCKKVDLTFNIVSDHSPETQNVEKLRRTSKDPSAFTQGFELSNGELYESGGQYGQSLLRKLDPNTGLSIKSIKIENKYFAEGITILNDKIYMLTWKEGEILIFDMDLNLLDKKPLHSTTGEGWGICNDGKSIIISDGSNKLTYINETSFVTEKTIEVYRGEVEESKLNELEYANDHIYANIWSSSQIVVIEPTTGRVIKVFELGPIVAENKDGEVLNGIAYLPKSRTFLVTGKYWRNMYEVRLLTE